MKSDVLPDIPPEQRLTVQSRTLPMPPLRIFGNYSWGFFSGLRGNRPCSLGFLCWATFQERVNPQSSYRKKLNQNHVFSIQTRLPHWFLSELFGLGPLISSRYCSLFMDRPPCCGLEFWSFCPLAWHDNIVVVKANPTCGIRLCVNIRL